MLTPSLRALKESNPERKVTLLTSSIGAETAKYIKEIDDVIVYDVPWEKNGGQEDSFNKTVATIKEKNFDAAIIFTSFSQNSFPSALLTYLAEIPLRLGYRRENPFHLLTHDIVDTEPFTPVSHEVVRQLSLISKIGAKTSNDLLSLTISEQAAQQTEEILKKLGVDVTRPFLVLHPGVSDHKRQYPEAGFSEAGKLLAETLSYQILVTGSASEVELCSRVAQAVGPNAFSLAGKLTLEEFIALVTLADAVITNNTATSHIAAAVQTPVVVLYARTNPQHTPWKVKSTVLYFDVEESLRSKNPLLVWVTPTEPKPDPTPKHILAATAALLEKPLTDRSEIPQEVVTW